MQKKCKIKRVGALRGRLVEGGHAGCIAKKKRKIKRVGSLRGMGIAKKVQN